MKIKSKNKIFSEMINKFWYAPNDAFLKAVEACIWQELKKDVKYPVLNIGCGDAVMDESLFQGYKKLTGLDNNERSIELAKKSKLYKRVVVSGAEKMPFKDGEFNTVISNSTFEHIKKDKEAIKEVSRVLKKRGQFIFSTTSLQLLEVLKDILNEKELDKFNRRFDHNHYRSLSEWKKILKDNDLIVEEYLYYHPKKNIRAWVNLFRFSTFIPYKREMWSYMKDSKISPYLPNKLISMFWYVLLKNMFLHSFDGKGTWLFIVAKNVK